MQSVGDLVLPCNTFRMLVALNPFPNDNIWTLKLKEFADDNFRSGENGRKFFRWVGVLRGSMVKCLTSQADEHKKRAMACG